MNKSKLINNDVKMGVNVDIEAKVKELLDNKQYEEVIQLMDQTLEKEQTSAYYFYRAYARDKISRHWDKNFEHILIHKDNYVPIKGHLQAKNGLCIGL